MKLITVVRKEILQLFFVILSFSLMVAVSYYFVSGIVENLIFVNAQETLNTAEVSIRSDIREAEVALLQVEMLIENWLRWGESYDEIRSYMALVAGSMTSDSDWVKGIMNVYGIVNNNFISGLYDTPPEHYIPEERPWYHTAEAAGGKVGLSTPYIDWETEKPVISLAKTMHDETGKRIGTIALDLDFSIISAYIESLHFSKGGYGLLCDENFILFAHPIKEYLNMHMEDTNPGYAKTIQDLQEQPFKISTQRMTSTEGEKIIIIFKRIQNGWHIGIVSPIASYFRDVQIMALTLSILGFLFMSILSFILIRLSLLKARSDEENLGKSTFLARMSHEIRTPMNSILGMAELIQRKSVSSEMREYIEIINQSGNNLLTIINDILDFSKIESGRLQIQNRDYSIASVINDMVNMMRPRIAEKSLSFIVNLESSIPAQLHGDDMRLRQILTNLLSNAVKYTHKGYISLDIGMEIIDSTTLKLICAIRDTGIGIKMEDKEKLFTEFARMDDIMNQGIEGTGLGLVITRALCRGMGGDVMVLSEYGKGSVFWAIITQEYENEEPVASVANPETKNVLFYDWRPEYVKSISYTLKTLGIKYKCPSEFQEFIKELEYGPFNYAFISSKQALDCIDIPGMRDEPLQLAIMVEPGEISAYREVTSILQPVYAVPIANVLNNTSGEVLYHDKKLKIQFTAPEANILIVDDISTNLRVAKELMAPYNMNVQTCLSGPEAINLVRNNLFDIVFMDHMMPGMDGIETTSLIRSINSKDDYFEKLPIIALTANAVYGQREIFLQNGINDFLAKPIEIQKLDEILEKWLPPEKLSEADQLHLEESGQERTEMTNIPGIDVLVGLKNCGGDVKIYFDILSDFCRDTELTIVKISDALIQEDTKLYVTLVHALKGASRSIGALETGDKAFWLEKMALKGNLDTVRGKNNDLQENVKTLIKNIRTVLDKNEPDESHESTEISSLRLETLKAALEEMDIEAVNRILLVFTGLSLDKDTKTKISEIEQLVLMFEYEKAIEKINEFF